MNGKTDGNQRNVPVFDWRVKLSRKLPWTLDPWENDEWELLRGTRHSRYWVEQSTGMEAHIFRDTEADGYIAVVVPGGDAPTVRETHLGLTPEPTSFETARYLAIQYMKNGVAITDCEGLKSVYPPRAKLVDEGVEGTRTEE